MKSIAPLNHSSCPHQRFLQVIKGYDTSSWEDVSETGERDQDYIEAAQAAEYV